jgi:H+-transporting ATPase
LRKEARDVVRFLERNGIDVCMVTGDNVAIATQIAHELELDGRVVTKDQLDALSDEEVSEKTLFHDAVAFAQILPEDKFRLVECAKHRYVVAANGDGVNDLPPVKAAHVGFAVKSAVSALRAAAEIVLLADGIGVIKDAILESRKIFERIYTYSVYRMSESLRLIITIAVLGALYGSYPMTALQIIVLALLNDIPIITLAFDRVKVAKSPAQMNVRARFTLSSLYGLVGVANSLLLFYITTHIWHLSWPIIQTMFFLKLTVSGHMLIYVAHTKERWWKFLPSREVIWATSATQLIATSLAATGFLMSGRLNLFQILFVWVWALFWMQVSECIKDVDKKLH